MPDPDAPMTDLVRRSQAPLEPKESTVDDTETQPDPAIVTERDGVPVYTPANIAAMRDEMAEFRRTGSVFALRVDGPFFLAVRNEEEGKRCEDGWLVFSPDHDDDRVFELHTMDDDEFQAEYELVFPDDEPEPGTPAAETNATPPSKPPEPPAAEAPSGVLPVDSPALVKQLAHRCTYLELVLTGLIRDLAERNVVVQSYEERAVRSADEALGGSHRARATTQGRSGLIALELVAAR